MFLLPWDDSLASQMPEGVEHGNHHRHLQGNDKLVPGSPDANVCGRCYFRAGERRDPAHRTNHLELDVLYRLYNLHTMVATEKKIRAVDGQRDGSFHCQNGRCWL